MTQASIAYDHRRRRLITEGAWLPPVPADQVREHIDSLRAAGMSQAAIAAASGVCARTIRGVCNGERPAVRGPNAAAILAVQPRQKPLRADTVPGCGTMRRIRGLVALGYSLTWIARRLDCPLQQVWDWAWERRPVVTAVNAAAVRALLEQWCATPGPSARARSEALRRGWFPPLAWDDIDDPAAQPVSTDESPIVDWVAVELALKGDPVTLTKLERHHAVHAGRARGMSFGVIANVLKLSGTTVKDLYAKPLPEDCEVAA